VNGFLERHQAGPYADRRASENGAESWMTAYLKVTLDLRSEVLENGPL